MDQGLNQELVLAEYLSELRQKQETKTNSPAIAMQLKRYLENIEKLTSFLEDNGYYTIESEPLTDEDVRPTYR